MQPYHNEDTTKRVLCIQNIFNEFVIFCKLRIIHLEKGVRHTNIFVQNFLGFSVHIFLGCDCVGSQIQDFVGCAPKVWIRKTKIDELMLIWA